MAQYIPKYFHYDWQWTENWSERLWTVLWSYSHNIPFLKEKFKSDKNIYVVLELLHYRIVEPVSVSKQSLQCVDQSSNQKANHEVKIFAYNFSCVSSYFRILCQRAPILLLTLLPCHPLWVVFLHVLLTWDCAGGVNFFYWTTNQTFDHNYSRVRKLLYDRFHPIIADTLLSRTYLDD